MICYIIYINAITFITCTLVTYHRGKVDDKSHKRAVSSPDAVFKCVHRVRDEILRRLNRVYEDVAGCSCARKCFHFLAASFALPQRHCHCQPLSFFAFLWFFFSLLSYHIFFLVIFHLFYQVPKISQFKSFFSSLSCCISFFQLLIPHFVYFRYTFNTSYMRNLFCLHPAFHYPFSYFG